MFWKMVPAYNIVHVLVNGAFTVYRPRAFIQGLLYRVCALHSHTDAGGNQLAHREQFSSEFCSRTLSNSRELGSN